MVSPQLLRALVGLDDSVKLLASSMDAVVFRETWKAIAVAINRQMYNEVATETRFSYQVHCLQILSLLYEIKYSVLCMKSSVCLVPRTK